MLRQTLVMTPISLIFIVVGLIYAGIILLRPKISFYILVFLCIFQLGWFERYFAATAYLSRLTYLAAMLSGTIIILGITEKFFDEFLSYPNSHFPYFLHFITQSQYLFIFRHYFNYSIDKHAYLFSKE